jgi:hypothetical protein
MSAGVAQSPNPYWIDELDRKHEGGPYGDSDSEVRLIEHEGRTGRLIVEEYTPPFRVIRLATTGDLLFLLCQQLDYTCEDGKVIKGGDGLLLVARKHPEREGTYWLAVRHWVFDEAFRGLVGEA